MMVTTIIIWELSVGQLRHQGSFDRYICKSGKQRYLTATGACFRAGQFDDFDDQSYAVDGLRQHFRLGV